MNGCQKCNLNSVKFISNISEDICVKKEDMLDDTNWSGIPNCSNLKNDSSELKCSKCAENFILEENEKECVSLSILNCLKVRKQTRECLECDMGLIPLNGQCV